MVIDVLTLTFVKFSFSNDQMVPKIHYFFKNINIVLNYVYKISTTTTGIKQDNDFIQTYQKQSP